MPWEIGPLEYTGIMPPILNCPKGQWLAEYFSNLTLTPPADLALCETVLDHSWGDGGPLALTDNFSARYTGIFTFLGGKVLFTVRADDGIRLWLDGALILDQWVDQTTTVYTVERLVTAGDHALKVEYYERSGNATCQVEWAVTPTPPPPQSDAVYVRLLPGQRQNNVKVNYRKGKISRDVLVTVNAGTVVKVDISGGMQ